MARTRRDMASPWFATVVGARASAAPDGRVRGRSVLGLLCLLSFAVPLSAQELDPRAYVHVPVNGTFLVSGFTVSHGAVVADPTLPVTDINATVETPSLGVARSFSLFGKTAQAFGSMPFSWAQASGRVLEDSKSITRAGLSDMRLRLSVLVSGAPAASPLEIAKSPRRTIVGTSLTVVAPTGEYSSERLINLGTNRWGFKPEFAVSRPIGERWLLDTYAGLWLFTANNSFYPGTSVRSQALMGAFQAHASYSFQPQMWAAFDATYYVGGQTTTNGIEADDQQSNLRVGATFAFPVGRRHSIKLAASRGAIIRYGADFSTISFGWQTGWVRKPATAR